MNKTYTKFKKGDKIVCVDDAIVSQIHPKLILNKTYTVDRLLEDNDIIYRLYQTYGLVLKEHPSYEFYGNRFVL